LAIFGNAFIIILASIVTTITPSVSANATNSQSQAEQSLGVGFMFRAIERGFRFALYGVCLFKRQDASPQTPGQDVSILTAP
jgi:energy-converting hydrogenase Eha subunit E